MLKKVAFVLAALVLGAAQSNAQGIRLGPEVGYYKTQDADDGKFMFGAALRLKLSSALGVEGAINYRQEKYGNDALTVRSWPILVTGMFYPLPIVYGALGAGWYNTTFDVNVPGIDNETQQEFGWHFGAGVEIPMGGNSRLTGDLRYVFLDYSFDSIPFQDVDSNFYMISAGFLFGL
ncbi:MAG TPA: outer membrane beta-barrel protein [bacterium]